MPISDLEKRKNYHREYNKKWYQKNKNKYTKICVVCGNKYSTRYLLSKFCSIGCFSIGRKNKQLCIQCGKEFSAPPSKKRKYCSQKCMISDPNIINRVSSMGKIFGKRVRSKSEKVRISDRQIGSKNHQWKGGITPEYRRLRNLKSYKEWRNNVFIRDNYTCVLCGSRNGNGIYIELNADHFPITFKQILKNNKSELLFDISNGRTLCVKCHKNHTFQERARYYKEIGYRLVYN